MNPRLRGFTLVELAICLFLMVLIAGAVTLSLRRKHRVLDMDWAVIELTQFDHRLRDRAKRFDQPLQWIVSVDDNHCRSVNQVTQEAVGSPLYLGGRVRVESVFLADQKVDHGEIAIAYNELGRSPTFIMKLVGGDSQNRVERSLLFVGMTGQVMEVLDSDAHEVVETWETTARPDDG